MRSLKSTPAFTLVELIVVVTILAVLATIGFLAFQDYSKDAKDSSMQAKVRTIAQAVNLESSRNVESARKYAKHDASYAMSGKILSGAMTLVPASFLSGSGNYAVGPVDFPSLRMNGAKYESDGTKYLLSSADATETLFSGRARNRSYFQIAAQSGSTVYVDGNFAPMGPSDVSGLIRDTNPYAPSNTPLVSNLGQAPVVYVPVTCNAGETVVGGVCKDPHAANVSLLAHFENNMSYSWIATQAFSYNGFGYGAGKFGQGLSASTGNRAEMVNEPSIIFWSSDYVIELWFKTTAGSICAYGAWNSGLPINDLCLDSTGKATLSATFNGTTHGITSSAWGLHDGNWHFAVVQRSGSTLELFIDWNSVGTKTVTWTNQDYGAAYSRKIGGTSNITSYDWRNGAIDEVRITKGVARYPSGASFTLPVQAFANP